MPPHKVLKEHTVHGSRSSDQTGFTRDKNLTDQFGILDMSISLVPQNGKRTTFFKSGRPAPTHTYYHNMCISQSSEETCHKTAQFLHVIVGLCIVANCFHREDDLRFDLGQPVQYPLCQKRGTHSPQPGHTVTHCDSKVWGGGGPRGS